MSPLEDHEGPGDDSQVVPALTLSEDGEDGDSWVPPPPDASLNGATDLWAGARTVTDAKTGDSERMDAVAIPGFVMRGECGRGGMGVVYRAEQVALRRQVAIKFLRPDLAGSEDQRQRFRAEGRASARLQHPNIVQVFDSGMIEGQAFIIQEFVGGGSLDRRLLTHPLGPRAAAELAEILARAIEHAHQHQIVHRDLKPGNVLLTTDGVPKISDFGLAKSLSEGLDDIDSAETRAGAVFGSPSYMAPEQAMGQRDQIGPAADIYALGAILYEFVVGRPPFRAATALETLEQVRSADPVPPRRLQPGLPRDLETICLTCLHKRPAMRYSTADALAGDLRRFLDGRPILARPASPLERLTKWARRRPAVAASSAIAVVAGVAVIVGGLIYQGLLRAAVTRAETNADRAKTQTALADSRYRLARETLDRMVAHLEHPRFAGTPALRELLRLQTDDALAFYDQVLVDVGNPDAAVRFDYASASIQAGMVQAQLGRTADAARRFDNALHVLEELTAAEPRRAEYRLALGRCRRALGSNGLPPVTTGRATPPSEHLSRAIDLFEGLVAEFPERPEYRSELALTLHNRATMDAAQGRHTDAEPYFRRAIDAWRPLLGPTATSGDVPARVGMADTHRNLAIGLQQGPRAAEASTHYAASRDLLVSVLQIEPGRDEAALALGGTLFNWAIFLSFLPDRRAESLDLFGQAIDRIAPIHAREGSWERARTELLTAHGGRAQLLAAMGRFTDSVKDWERVVVLEGPNPSSDNRFHLATARVRVKDRAGALEMVKVLEPLLTGRSTAHALHLARVCGMGLDGVGPKSDLPESERQIWADRFAREGIEILRSLLARCGFIERAVLRKTLPDDPDLAPLLARPEARDLLDAKAAVPLNPAAAPGPRDNK